MLIQSIRDELALAEAILNSARAAADGIDDPIATTHADEAVYHANKAAKVLRVRLLRVRLECTEKREISNHGRPDEISADRI